MPAAAEGARRARRQLVAVALWAAAFAFVEAAIVVYLRRIFHPEGFAFPLKPGAYDPILPVEVVREAATMVMLAAVGWLAGRRGWARFAYVMVAFGVWDIFYYVWLWAVLGWPPSLGTLDVLFLIPVVWVGPVWAPCVVSLGLIGCGAAVALRVEGGGRFAFGPWGWALAVAAGLLIVLSFLWRGPEAMRGEMPGPYPWPVFWAGMLLGLGTFLWAWRRG